MNVRFILNIVKNIDSLSPPFEKGQAEPACTSRGSFPQIFSFQHAALYNAAVLPAERHHKYACSQQTQPQS